MKEKASKFWEWYKTTALLLGLPLMLVVLVGGSSRVFFTGTCVIASFKCKYALASQDEMKKYVSSVVGG